MPRENKSFVPIGACSNSSNLPTDKTSTSCLFCPQTVEREEKFADNVGIQHRLRSICAVLKGAGKWQVCAGKLSTLVGEGQFHGGGDAVGSAEHGLSCLVEVAACNKDDEDESPTH